MPPPRQTLLIYAQDSLAILRRSLQLYQQGHRPFYRVTALQLRLLLCDTTRRHNQAVDIALLPQLIPYLELPAFGTGGTRLPLKVWLAQHIPGQTDQALTIRLLIRRVCDQDGGAHVDFRPAARLENVDPAEWMQIIGEIVMNNVKLE